jgi:HEAT repeat protein
MSSAFPSWLNLAMLLVALDAHVGSPADPACLREQLYDRQQIRSQSQTALLLVQHPSREAEDIVREGLLQTDSGEVFLALASAIRLQHDVRFQEELLGVLVNGQAAPRQAAAEALAELADPKILIRLQALIEDSRAEMSARQLALWVLGRSGRKSAVIILLDQLSSENEVITRDAATALGELTGQNLGNDLNRWKAWWDRHKDLSNEQWLEQRLLHVASRSRRLEGDLERSKAQVVRLHQQLYARLPVADRLGHVQSLVEHEDPAVRSLAVNWSAELLAGADTVGQRALSELLLRLSRDGNVEVQRLAVLSLGRIQDQRVLDQLRSLIQRGAAPVRAAAARSLAQQARGQGQEAEGRRRQVVPVLQKGLEDPALEVVVEAAEDLGALGVPEAGPVLAVLLRHPSGPVRQAAAQALERVADLAVLDGLLEALDDSTAAVRFSLVGAVGHAVGDGQNLSDIQRAAVLPRLENLLVKDADPGVRSRAATVLGEFGSVMTLPTLWRRVTAAEDGRVQEKSWLAMVEILCRTGNTDLLQEWDRTLVAEKQGRRRLQLLAEAVSRWQKKEGTKVGVEPLLPLLIEAQLEQGKWAAALPLIREQLAKTSDADVDTCLHWLLRAGEQALKEGNRAETLRMVQDAQPLLNQRKGMAAEFEALERQARNLP